MAVSDSGSWKLLIFPLILVVVVSLVVEATIIPFVREGIPTENTISPFGVNLIQELSVGLDETNLSIYFSNVTSGTGSNDLLGLIGIGFDYIFGVDPVAFIDHITYNTLSLLFTTFIPPNARLYIIDRVISWYYLPEWIQTPLMIIILVSVIYALYVLGTMLIP